MNRSKIGYCKVGLLTFLCSLFPFILSANEKFNTCESEKKMFKEGLARFEREQTEKFLSVESKVLPNLKGRRVLELAEKMRELKKMKGQSSEVGIGEQSDLFTSSQSKRKKTSQKNKASFSQDVGREFDKHIKVEFEKVKKDFKKEIYVALNEKMKASKMETSYLFDHDKRAIYLSPTKVIFFDAFALDDWDPKSDNVELDLFYREFDKTEELKLVISDSGVTLSQRGEFSKSLNAKWNAFFLEQVKLNTTFFHKNISKDWQSFDEKRFRYNNYLHDLRIELSTDFHDPAQVPQFLYFLKIKNGFESKEISNFPLNFEQFFAAFGSCD